LPKGVIRDADPAWFGNAFKPCGDVDAVPEDIIALDQYVAEMNADAPFHAAFVGDARIPRRRKPLQREAALDSADHRTELD